MDRLPGWRDVVAVVAHPDDESFALGAVLSAFADAGASVRVLCLTRGEASTLHGVPGDLAQVRARELAEAADALGVAQAGLCDYPDGGLSGIDLDALSGEVAAFVGDAAVSGLVVFDPSGVTGHPDHARATEAAVAFAAARRLPVLAWTIPAGVASTLNQEYGAAFSGHDPAEIDLVPDVERSRQRLAVACHASQALPGSVLWRRLDLLGRNEYLRWLSQG